MSSSRSRAMKIIGADEVGAVVHRDVRPVLQRGGDVAVVGRLVLALDRVDGDAEVVDQAGGDVVLGRERVGRDEHEVGAAGDEGPGEVGRLGRDVQAGRHPQAGQRLLDLEPLADRPEHGHVALGPDDPLVADRGQAQVFDIAGNRGGSQGSSPRWKRKASIAGRRGPGRRRVRRVASTIRSKVRLGSTRRLRRRSGAA